MVPYSRTRLYITTDMFHENVWFARTDETRYARFELKEDGVYIWFYKDHYLMTRPTLTDSLKLIEKKFIRWIYETYARKE